MSEISDTPLEVLPASVMYQLEKAQIDGQIATAHAFPRSPAKFQKRAIDMVSIDLDTAESCIYARPVGGGKTAEGFSIRLAEIVAACYGNIRVSARIIEQTDRLVKCEGVAHDLETNYAGKSEAVEPTVTREGKPYSEGQRAVVAKACLAKAYRDAIFKVVPRALCKGIEKAARAVIEKEQPTLEERRKKAQAWLRSIKVADANVFGVLGVNGWTEVNEDQLITLTGLRTAINDNETTVADAFPATVLPPKMATDKAKDELFPPAGGSNPSGAQNQTGPAAGPVTTLVNVQCKMNDAGITEAEVITFLRKKGLVDDSLSTLADIWNIKPSAIETVNTLWSDSAKRIKAARPA